MRSTTRNKQLRTLTAMLTAAVLFLCALTGCASVDSRYEGGCFDGGTALQGQHFAENNDPTPTPDPNAPSPTPTPRLPLWMQDGDVQSPTVGVGGSGSVSRHGYSTSKILSYFSEIALSAEYGDGSSEVRKWKSSIKLYVCGAPSTADWTVINAVVAKMNKVDGFPGISIVKNESDSNLVMYFYGDTEYDRITPSMITDRTDGFATCWFGSSSVIVRGKIGIRMSITQTERNSVIWEELVQVTGLQNDSYSYPDSLFYQGYNEVQQPTTLDWILFEVLYSPLIAPGMSYSEVSDVLPSILR